MYNIYIEREKKQKTYLDSFMYRLRYNLRGWYNSFAQALNMTFSEMMVSQRLL